MRSLVLLPALLLLTPACDSKKEPKANPAADKKAAEDAELEAKLKKRKEEREAKVVAEKKAAEELQQKIVEVSVIPEGAKLPKKAAKACDQVVEAQTGFMKKFHPGIEEAALTTQLGLIRKQCIEMSDIKVAMCQKFALEATTEELKGKINEYLPVCMEKYKKEG